MGIALGNVYGNSKDGVGIKINLTQAKGELRMYLKNGKELWVHLNTKMVFNGRYEGDYKIMSMWPGTLLASVLCRIVRSQNRKENSSLKIPS
jgi:hypothetical protein